MAANQFFIRNTVKFFEGLVVALLQQCGLCWPESLEMVSIIRLIRSSFIIVLWN